MQQHFCESSDFPEYTPAEEEAMMLKTIYYTSMYASIW
uniref:Uncharacterized protein n=1 Tax=Phytophthora ramorum TaxID=164328 RepID=H3HDJ5_PHYRM